MESAIATPTMFGNEILSHPQPQHPPLSEHNPSQVLQECATSIVTRLGDGIEDVSFREFVDLVLTVSGRTSEISMFVEQDISKRKSSILRSIYFSFLENKLQDPPQDPPAGSTAATEISPMTFPEDENEETCCKTSTRDRPLPIETESRTSTITAISWSSASAFEIVDHETPELFADSFHFVSDFDSDDDESLDSEDDRSMVVFLEKEQEKNLCRRSIRTPAIITTTYSEDRIELPRDFEVVTIVDAPDAVHLGRTFSITTSTTSAQSSSSSRSSLFSNRWIPHIFSSVSASESATEATTTAELEAAIITTPVPMQQPRESRPSDMIALHLSSTFEKIKRIGSKSTTGSF